VVLNTIVKIETMQAGETAPASQREVLYTPSLRIFPPLCCHPEEVWRTQSLSGLSDS